MIYVSKTDYFNNRKQIEMGAKTLENWKIAKIACTHYMKSAYICKLHGIYYLSLKGNIPDCCLAQWSGDTENKDVIGIITGRGRNHIEKQFKEYCENAGLKYSLRPLLSNSEKRALQGIVDFEKDTAGKMLKHLYNGE